MKQVIIVRHAKAVPYGYSDDYNRDLRERGKNDAKLISNYLKEKNIIPDFILTSPAKRAKKTATIFAKTLNFKRKQIIELEEIYEGLTTVDFVEVLNNIPFECKTAFVFGHNPGVHYFASNLAADFDGDMPTCSTVGINFDVDDWKEVQSRSGKVAFQVTPKMFK